MLSAVFGTVKSFLRAAADKQETSTQSSEDVNPEQTSGQKARKCPYDGLEYGQSTCDIDEDEDTKEKSSFTGKVTDLLYGYGLIDNNIYFTFDCVVGGQHPTVGDSVVVEAVRDHDAGGWKATKVDIWNNWDDETANGQNPQSGSLIGKVTKVTQDFGFINETVPFDQDSLVFGYKPCRGDWIQGDLICDPSGDHAQVRNVRPLREQKFSGSVTHLYPGYGHVNGKIYFAFRICEGGWRPKKGDLVEGRMIEAQQSKGNWRAVSMKQDARSNGLRKLETVTDSPLAQCLKEDMKRNKGGIVISDGDLGVCLIGSSKSTTVYIRNVGREAQTLTSYEVVCPTGDVSVNFIPASSSGSPRQLNQVMLSSSSSETTGMTPPVALPTQASVMVTLTVTAKQLGKCLCQVTYHFDGFSISRLYTLNAQDQQVIELVPEGYAAGVNRSARNRRRGKMAGTREGDFEGCVYPGVRPTRNFDINVPVKLPQYPVPRDLRSCVLEDGEVVKICPQLLESLRLENFSRRFSALLHLEEIKMDEDMREFDMDRVSMRPRGEFLSLEVPGLAEGRPSVLIGDKIILTHPNNIRYDGYVHEVLGEAVLLKFHPSFHELYQAEECSVMFTYSRTSLRRCHQACEFAKNLGSQVLFPTKVEAKPPQVSMSFRQHATSSVLKPIHGKPRHIIKLPTPPKMTSSTKPPGLSNKRTNATPPRFVKQKGLTLEVDQSSDDEDVAGPSSLPALTDEEGEEQTSDSERSSTEEEPMSLELEDEPAIIDDAEDETEAAAVRAGTVVDLEPPKDRVNKCHCTLFNGQRCIEQFTAAESNEIRYTVAELSEFEKDLLLLGIISTSIIDGLTTARKKQKQKHRKQTRIRSFNYGHKRVCRDTFFFLMGIGPEKFTNLKRWYTTHGLVPRRKKSAASNCSESDSNGKFVTPRIQDMKVSHVAGDGQKMAEFINPRLNARQRSAVVRVLQGEGRPTPYIIFGPPGTGKTVTVVEAVLQVHIHVAASRILACTPSNSAADLLTERLHESGKVDPVDMVRLNAFSRSVENIPDCIKPYAKDGQNLTLISHQRIIICTCTTAGSLYQLGLKSGHFTHVFVDEAGQATEPECLIPVGLSVGSEGQIILAGDPMQLGPVLSSHVAKHYGLGQSYLERLILRTVYRRDADKYRDHGCYDPLLVTKLVENYRSHPALLKLSSQLFYHNELQPRADPKLTHTLTSWEKLPNRNGDCPLVFHGVLGDDMREGNSPSWFNPVEVVQVIRYVQILLNSTSPVISPEDIGIITPYRKQVEKMRLLLVSLSIDGIKVGSVEEFQGQERVAMLISTVRSTEDLLAFDLRHHLGFLSNPKRFNVSITRAQALMIIVGNPHLLAKDKHWRALIRYCQECGAYTGCQPPTLQPEELDDEGESLDGGQEPDASSPRQQESKTSDGADTSGVLACDYQLNWGPVSEPDTGLVEEVVTRENRSQEFQKTDLRNEASQESSLGDRKNKAILDNVDTGFNLIQTSVPVANTNHFVLEESQSYRTQEVSQHHSGIWSAKLTSDPAGPNFPVQKDEAAVANADADANSVQPRVPIGTAVHSGLCMDAVESCKELHQFDPSSEQLQPDANVSPSNGPKSDGSSTISTVELSSNDSFILLKEKESKNLQSELINGGTRASTSFTNSRDVTDKESSIEETDPVTSCDGILVANDGSKRTLTPWYFKKPRGHSSYSFSSNSELDDTEEFLELLDENDLNETWSSADTQLGQGQNLPNQAPASASVKRTHQDRLSQLCQGSSSTETAEIRKEESTEAMLSNGTFLDAEICSVDETITHVSFTHPKNQSSPSTEHINIPHRLNQSGSCLKETAKSVDTEVNHKIDSIQICSQEEDPEIWDEEYDISRVPHHSPQEARHLHDRPAGSEKQSEETEKWDDYTWDVQPRLDPSIQPFGSFQGPWPAPEKDNVHLEDKSVLLGLHESSRDDKPGLFNDRTDVNPEAETLLGINPNHEMPALEGWLHQEGLDNTDNTQEVSHIPAVQPTTNAQVYNNYKPRQAEVVHPTTQLTSQSCEAADRTKVSSEGAKSPRPFLPGLGRGRGILTEKLRQAGHSKKAGGRNSPFKNPWRVGAPTYSNSPKTVTSHQSRRQVHQSDQPTLEATCEMADDNHEMLPRASENLEFRTTQGCLQHTPKTMASQLPRQQVHKTMASQLPRQQAHQTTDPMLDATCKTTHDNEAMLLRASENIALRTTQDCLQQDAIQTTITTPAQQDYNSETCHDDPHQSGSHDDTDDWSGDQHPHFFYRRPISNHQKGGKWKYTLRMGSNAPATQTKRYTTDEDFMGNVQQSVSARTQDGLAVGGRMRTDLRWEGAYPVAQSLEMMEDYDVIIESSEDSSDSAHTPQHPV